MTQEQKIIRAKVGLLELVVTISVGAPWLGHRLRA